MVTWKDVAVKHGLPAEEIISHLSKEITALGVLRSIPFYLLLGLSYAMMILAHDNAPDVHAVEDSLTHAISERANFAFTSDSMGWKNLYDVSGYADFWSWMSLGLVPLVFVQETQFAENRNDSLPFVGDYKQTIETKDRGMFLGYNRIVLGVRLSQERYSVVDGFRGYVPCKWEPLNQVYNKNCVGGTGYEKEPDRFQASQTKNPARVEFLYIHDDKKVVQARVAELEKSMWLDERTKKVEVALAVYNGEYGLHTLVMMDFFFSRGGLIWKDVIPLSAFANLISFWYNYLFDITWLSCVSWIMFSEVVEIGLTVGMYGQRGLLYNYLGFWNVINWLSVFAGIVICALFLANEAKTRILNTALADLSRIDVLTDGYRYRKQGELYWAALEDSVNYLYWFKLVLAIYPLGILIHLLKAFSAQPSLAIFAKAIKAALVDLAHCAIIFSSVFLMYAVAGVVLFDQQTQSFITLSQSMNTCLLVMQRDFNWEEMRLAGRATAAVWFLPFTVLIVFILSHMVTAIVVEAYFEAKFVAGDLNSLGGEAMKIVRRWTGSQRHEYADLTKVLNKLQDRINEENDLKDQVEADQAPRKVADAMRRSITWHGPGYAAMTGGRPPTLLTISTLKEWLGPEMRLSQREEIMKHSILAFYKQNRVASGTDELLHLMGGVVSRSKHLKQHERNRMGAVGQACNHPDEVASLYRQCCEEVAAARADLTGWLPSDREDAPLPEAWLEARKGGEEVDNTAVFERGSHNLEALEAEVRLGRKTKVEALQAIEELHRRLLRVRGERRGMVKTYNRLLTRHRELGREIKLHQEESSHQTVKLRTIASERDKLFDKARALVEEGEDFKLDARQKPSGSRERNRERDRHSPGEHVGFQVQLQEKQRRLGPRRSSA